MNWYHSLIYPKAPKYIHSTVHNQNPNQQYYLSLPAHLPKADEKKHKEELTFLQRTNHRLKQQVHPVVPYSSNP